MEEREPGTIPKGAKKKGKISFRCVVDEEMHFFVDDPPDGTGKPPNELRIAVIQARDLPVMDKALFGGGGSSDPVVRLICGGERRETEVRKKSLFPVWNEPHCLPIHGGGPAGQLSRLRVIVEDWDLVGANDFMGSVSIDLKKCRDKEVRRAWFPLYSEAAETFHVQGPDGPAGPPAFNSSGTLPGLHW